MKLLRVLYAESNPEDEKKARVFFAHANKSIELNIVTSYEAFRTEICNKKPDILLLDNRLQHPTGIDLPGEINGLGLQIPIVMLLASGEKKTNAPPSCSSILVKRNNYLPKLLDLLKRMGDELDHKRNAQSPEPQRRRILYLDIDPKDTRSDCKSLSEIATRFVFEFGQIDESKLKLASQYSKSDAVIVDLHSYGMDSLEKLRQLKCQALDLPYIILTAPESEDVAIAALDAGADDYILKCGNYHRRLTHAIERSIALKDLNQTYLAKQDMVTQGLEEKVRRTTEELSCEVNKRKKLQKQLLHSQKMETIGTLAGGVAHDFNNLLTAILGHIDLALSETRMAEQIRYHFIEIKKVGNRAADLIDQLLTFSRRKTTQKRLLNLNDPVQDLVGLHRILGENITIAFDLQPSLRTVFVDPGQMQQVLLNLFTNARDAMPNGGLLKLRTRNVKRPELKGFRDLKRGAKEFVMISVEDNGMGMNRRTLVKIFDPFFTTKELGKGTGLGLATAYGIVREHEGSLKVESKPGKGTIFHVLLPTVATNVSQPQPKKLLTTSHGNGETILIVEDEEIVRNVAVRILNGLSYRVLIANDGDEALSIFSSEKDKIDLILMDVVMPKISGPEVYHQINALKPGVPAIFVTGYDLKASYANIKEDAVMAKCTIIQKPYTREMLAMKIREVLDRAHEPEKSVQAPLKPVHSARPHVERVARS